MCRIDCREQGGFVLDETGCEICKCAGDAAETSSLPTPPPTGPADDSSSSSASEDDDKTSAGSIVLIVFLLLALCAATIGFALYKQRQAPASGTFMGRDGGNAHENPMYQNPMHDLAPGNLPSGSGPVYSAPEADGDNIYSSPNAGAVADSAC